MQCAIGSHLQQPVVSTTTGTVITDTNAKTALLAATQISGLSFARIPIEGSPSLIQRFCNKGTGDRALAAALEAITAQCIKTAKRNAIHAYFGSDLVGHRRQYCCHFILTRTALCTAWCGVGVNGNTAITHGFRLQANRGVLCRGVTTTATSCTSVVNDSEINRTNLAVFSYTDLDPALDTRAG